MKHSKSEIAAGSTSDSSTPKITHNIQSQEPRLCSHNYTHVMVREFENIPPKFHTISFLHQNRENQTKTGVFFTSLIREIKWQARQK